eukprot:Sdes_comp20826_c0_seq1m17410
MRLGAHCVQFISTVGRENTNDVMAFVAVLFLVPSVDIRIIQMYFDSLEKQTKTMDGKIYLHKSLQKILQPENQNHLIWPDSCPKPNSQSEIEKLNSEMSSNQVVKYAFSANDEKACKKFFLSKAGAFYRKIYSKFTTLQKQNVKNAAEAMYAAIKTAFKAINLRERFIESDNGNLGIVLESSRLIDPSVDEKKQN